MSDFGPSRTRTQRDHIELVLEIGQRVNGEHDLDRLLQLTVQAVKDRLGYPSCAILLAEGTDLVIRAVTEYPEAIVGHRIPVGVGITGRCAQHRSEVLVTDVSQCPDYLHLGDRAFGSELDIPLIFRGKLLGVLNTQGTGTNAFDDRDVHTLKILGTQIGVALHNAQIRTQLELVQDIGLQLATIVRTDELFPWIVTQVQERLHHDSCAILQADGSRLVLAASTGGLAKDPVGMQIAFGEGITGRCAAEKRVVNVGNVRTDAGYIPSGVAEACSEIALPICFGDELLGVLTIESGVENAFDDDDVRLLSTLGAHAAVCLHQARVFTEFERMAVTDGLTGLYNYRYFHDRLRGEIARCTRYGHALSIVMVDLDNFKAINDRFGHLAGDEVLREVARQIKRNIRGSEARAAMRRADVDIASRYGGEEFIIIMPEALAEGAAVAAERLRSVFEAEVAPTVGLFDEQHEPWKVTGSFGVAGFVPGMEPEAFIRRADEAVYRAKHSGKNRVVVAETLPPRPAGR